MKSGTAVTTTPATRLPPARAGRGSGVLGGGGGWGGGLHDCRSTEAVGSLFARLSSSLMGKGEVDLSEVTKNNTAVPLTVLGASVCGQVSRRAPCVPPPPGGHAGVYAFLRTTQQTTAVAGMTNGRITEGECPTNGLTLLTILLTLLTKEVVV